MKRLPLLTIALLLLAATTSAQESQPTSKPAPKNDRLPDGWLVNDRSRPRPPRVEPKSEADLAHSAQPPASAIILFDGKSLDQFQPSNWKLADGYVELVPPPKKSAASQPQTPQPKTPALLTSQLTPEEQAAKGNLVTKQAFGSCQLHLEFACPNPPKGKDQAAANSGVYLMGKYEMQVLDNTDNPTYADGLAGSVYGENPPLAESSRPSGEWNYYDITFHAPTFSSDGKLLTPARVTASLNGILVQDNFQLLGPTEHLIRVPYTAHAEKLPLMLQNHGQIVRYRNIWITPLSD